jgi:hypothetical protein
MAGTGWTDISGGTVTPPWPSLLRCCLLTTVLRLLLLFARVDTGKKQQKPVAGSEVTHM